MTVVIFYVEMSVELPKKKKKNTAFSDHLNGYDNFTVLDLNVYV